MRSDVLGTKSNLFQKKFSKLEARNILYMSIILLLVMKTKNTYSDNFTHRVFLSSFPRILVIVFEWTDIGVGRLDIEFMNLEGRR